MKILIFNWRDIKNPEAGGAEIFTHENARRWVKVDHEVTLFTSEFDGCKKEEIIDGVRVVRAGEKIWVYQKAKEYYKKYFSQENSDLVVDEINTRPFFTPNFVNNGERIITLIHQLAREYWFYEVPFPLNFIGYFLENGWLKNYVDKPTITVSESTKKELIDLGFKKVFVVSEGLSFKALEKMPEKEREPTIVYLGRLKKAKRPDLCIKSFQIVKGKLPSAKLWIVGNGYYKKKLEKIAGEGVRFLDKVSEKDKIELLSKAWILVNPSVREGWGINIIEANACGTPCIAYDVPGLRDSIIDGETGILVKENGNVEKLAEAIILLLEDAELRNNLSKKALEHSKKFSWDETSEEFLKVIREVVNEKR